MSHNGKTSASKLPTSTADAERRPFWQRLAWLLLIWTVSVASLGLVAYLLRLFMNAAGMTS